VKILLWSRPVSVATVLIAGAIVCIDDARRVVADKVDSRMENPLRRQEALFNRCGAL
jgi:hypothetical protein